MTNTTTENDQDWVVPAVLVAVIAVLMLIIGIVIGVRAASDPDDSVAGQLERWTTCLRSEGTNVPLVESMRDGGFRVTVDGALLDDGLDHEALRPALAACEDEAPEAVQGILSLVGGFSEMPFAGFGDGLFEFGDVFDSALRP
ncbi:MAG: hypothetical protein ABFR95_07805 [Actinomycetota bacterium]